MRCQVGLNTVPANGNGATNYCRNIGTQDSKRRTADHRVGDTVFLAWFCDFVGHQPDNLDSNEQANEDLPTCQPESKKAPGKDISTDTVDIRHPITENIIGPPGLALQRRKFVINQVRGSIRQV